MRRQMMLHTIIDPFDPELYSYPSFVKWSKECQEMIIKHDNVSNRR